MLKCLKMRVSLCESREQPEVLAHVEHTIEAEAELDEKRIIGVTYFVYLYRLG